MRSLLAIILLLGVIRLSAQELEFGNVPDAEVAMKSYENDSLAPAMFLNKSRITYFDHQHPEGWVVITEVHERIKILNSDGLKYGTKKVQLYREGPRKERISNIKAYTFNRAGGKAVGSKLKSAGIFETRVSDNIEEASMAFPNVKVGSVIDVAYKITSPFWEIDDVAIQDDIPVRHYFAEIYTPGFIKYNRKARGGFEVSSNDHTAERNVTVSWEQDDRMVQTQATKTAVIRIEDFISTYEYKDIPALTSESYVDNINNYRFAIDYELMETEFPRSGKIEYVTTWDKVVKTIYDSDNFGKQLVGVRFLEDDVKVITDRHSVKIEQMNAIFDFVKNKMTWNQIESAFTDDGLRKAYKENTGNVTEINLILVAMLQKAGLESTPVLVSTRNHGIPLYPTIEGFNYTIAAAKVNNQVYLMDATEKLSTPNLIPTRVLNWEGTMIKSDGTSRKVSLYPTNLSQRNTLLNLTLQHDGSASGVQKNNYTSLEAFNFRIRNYKVPVAKRVEGIANLYNLSDVSEFSVEGMDDLEGSITENFELKIETAAETIGDKLYINPLLHLTLDKNPFVLQERNYPIDYAYPSLNRKIISITIPQGYQVESLPEPLSIAMPNGVGSFKYNVSEVQGVLSVRSSFTIKTSVLPADQYASIKEFYNQRVLKENEKVVLSKI